MSKALELIRTLIDGANEYEKKTGNTNPTVYLSRNNLLVIKQALIKAEKEHKVLEVIKEKRIDIESFYSSFIERDFNYDFYSSWYGSYGKGKLTEEEFNLLNEILGC